MYKAEQLKLAKGTDGTQDYYVLAMTSKLYLGVRVIAQIKNDVVVVVKVRAAKIDDDLKARLPKELQELIGGTFKNDPGVEAHNTFETFPWTKTAKTHCSTQFINGASKSLRGQFEEALLMQEKKIPILADTLYAYLSRSPAEVIKLVDRDGIEQVLRREWHMQTGLPTEKASKEAVQNVLAQFLNNKPE